VINYLRCYRWTRYRGLGKNAAKVYTLAALANFYLAHDSPLAAAIADACSDIVHNRIETTTGLTHNAAALNLDRRSRSAWISDCTLLNLPIRQRLNLIYKRPPGLAPADKAIVNF